MRASPSHHQATSSNTSAGHGYIAPFRVGRDERPSPRGPPAWAEFSAGHGLPRLIFDGGADDPRLAAADLLWIGPPALAGTAIETTIGEAHAL